MPLVRVDIYKGKTAQYKKAILDGIHQALVDAFKIPEHDRNQRIYEFEEENFEKSSNKTKDITIIEITAFKGRGREAKKNLYFEISKNLKKSPGINSSDIIIDIHEPSLENWGIQGKIGDEVNLGFKINL